MLYFYAKYILGLVESIANNSFLENEYKCGATPSITSAVRYVSKKEIDVQVKQLAILWIKICWVGK